IHPNALDIPIRRKGSTIFFVNSMSDLFHEEVPQDFIQQVFAVMARCPQHTFQVLTKRPNRMLDVLPRVLESLPLSGLGTAATSISLPNVWLGTSVEDQHAADARIPALLQTPASVRFLSLEPLLGPIEELSLAGIDWVIVGGESGPKARPMLREWVTSIRERCVNEGVPFFFKQWGGVRKKRNGRILDGRTWDEMPKCRGRPVAT